MKRIVFFLLFGVKLLSCSGDCWQCYEIKEVVKSGVAAHKGLSVCKKCHFKSVNLPECDEIKTSPILLEMIRKK